MRPHGPDRQGSRATRPGFRPLSLLLAGVVCAGSVAACGSTTRARYGGLPSFLPKTSTPVDRIVSASAANPQLAVQGASVAVTLPEGRVLATAAGPRVPPFVAPPPPNVTTTFTVTLARASGSVPVALRDFTILDQLGRLVHPVLVAGEPTPAAVVPAGTTESFDLTAVLPVGEGQLQWSPGGVPIVRWDFVVEND